jgi:hypothetical protein
MYTLAPSWCGHNSLVTSACGWLGAIKFTFLSAFRGPPAQPSDALEDNVPDVHDEADFDIPNTQAVLERFMSNMSKLADDEYLSLSVLLDSLPDPSSLSMLHTFWRFMSRKQKKQSLLGTEFVS